MHFKNGRKKVREWKKLNICEEGMLMVGVLRKEETTVEMEPLALGTLESTGSSSIVTEDRGM